MRPVCGTELTRSVKPWKNSRSSTTAKWTAMFWAWLGRVGYDPVYGARPLKRAVQRYLQDPLADMILRGDIPDGSTVRVDEGDGALALALA